MHLPKFVRIGPINYEVKELDDLHFVDEDGKKHLLHGDIRWAEADIRIEASQNDQKKVAAIWHEAVHGILHQAAQDVKEEIVIALGYGLVQLLRDNPELIDLTLHPEMDADRVQLLERMSISANGQNHS